MVTPSVSCHWCPSSFAFEGQKAHRPDTTVRVSEVGLRSPVEWASAMQM
jgi:hypothetical protein